MRIKRSLKLRDSLSHQLFNLLDNTRRFHWSHTFYLEKRAEFYSTEAYAKAPEWIKVYLEGLEWGILREIWREVVFSYVIDSKRITLDSPEYKGYSSCYISEHCGNSGQYVWKADNSKLWTGDVKELPSKG